MRRPLLEGAWRAATVSLIQIQSTHSWNSILTKLGRWTPGVSLCNVIYRFTLLPCQNFFVLAMLVGKYSHSSMLLLQCKLCDAKGRSAPNNGAQKFPSSNKQGQWTKRNLIQDLKSQMPCVCAAQVCTPSQVGLHWFARWHSKEPTLDAICHPRQRRPLPVVDEPLDFEDCIPPSGQQSPVG